MVDIQTIDSVKPLQAEKRHIYSFIIVMHSGYTDYWFSETTSSRKRAHIYSFIIVMHGGYTDNRFSETTSSRKKTHIFFYNSYA